MFLYEQINLIITTRNFCEKVIFTGFSTPPNFYKAIYFLRVFTNMRGKLLMESNMKLLCFLMMHSFCEQDIWQKLKKKSSKIKQDKKHLISPFAQILTAIAKYFFRRDRDDRPCLTQLCDFPNVS